jgi:hypothetical protein
MIKDFIARIWKNMTDNLSTPGAVLVVAVLSMLGLFPAFKKIKEKVRPQGYC